MNEAVSAAAVPEKHSEESVEFEELPEGAIGAPKYLDIDVSAHTELTSYHDE